MRDSVLLHPSRRFALVVGFGEEHVRMMLVIPGEGRFPTLRLDDIESCVEKLSND